MNVDQQFARRLLKNGFPTKNVRCLMRLGNRPERRSERLSGIPIGDKDPCNRQLSRSECTLVRQMPKGCAIDGARI
jgi:hypothetical protein